MQPKKISVIFAVFLLSACGGVSGASGETEKAPAGPESTTDSDQQTGVPSGESSRPTEALTVWLSPTSVYGRVFFADELSGLTDALAEALSSGSEGRLHILPPGELREFQRSLRMGYLPGSRQYCESPPPPAMLYKHLHPEAGMADVRISCKESCLLTVVIEGPEYKSEKGYFLRDEVLRLEARLPLTGSPDEWSQLLNAGLLQIAAPPPFNGGLGLMGGRRNSLRKGQFSLALSKLEQEGNWRAPLTEALFAPAAKKLHVCKNTTSRRNDFWVQPFIVEVTEAGKISRCESKYPHRLDPPGFSCQCAVLKELQLDKAAGSRRAEFTIETWSGDDTPALPETATMTWVTTRYETDDPEIVLAGTVFEDDDIKKCTASIEPNRLFNIRFSARVQPTGSIDGLSWQWPEDLDPAIRECIAAAISRAQFNCPVNGSANVNAAMEIKIRKKKSPK